MLPLASCHAELILKVANPFPSIEPLGPVRIGFAASALICISRVSRAAPVAQWTRRPRRGRSQSRRPAGHLRRQTDRLRTLEPRAVVALGFCKTRELGRVIQAGSRVCKGHHLKIALWGKPVPTR
jgi:hypothetical protein